MAKKKTFYYHEDKHDDFGGVGVNHKPLPDNYKYIHKNIFFRILSFILYYLIAFPILFIYAKIATGVRVHGKKRWRKSIGKKDGVFFYSNHVHYYDAFFSHVFVGVPKRVFVVSNPDPVRIPFVGVLVEMLGCLPLPNNRRNFRNYNEAMDYYLKKCAMISIYPEATLWPYYNKLRPMAKASFKYPAMYNKPIVICAETFRKPKVFKFLKPRVDLTLSEVIYPDENKTVNENMEMFYQKAMEFWMEHVELNESNICLHNYQPIDKNGD